MRLDRGARIAWLARAGWLASLDEEELGRLADDSVVRGLSRGEVLVRRGDTLDALAVVLAGRLDVVREHHGRRMRLRSLSPGALFGVSLACGARASAEVTAGERDTSILVVRGRALRALFARRPDVGLGAITSLAELVDRLTEELVEAETLPLEERVLRHLLRAGEGRREVTTTQQEIADAIGATRERVNRALSRLRRRGLLDLERGRVRL